MTSSNSVLFFSVSVNGSSLSGSEQPSYHELSIIGYYSVPKPSNKSLVTSSLVLVLHDGYDFKSDAQCCVES